MMGHALFLGHRFILHIGIALAFLLPSVSGQSSTQTSTSLDTEIVKSTVESLAEVIRREYVDPDVAARVDTLLRQKLAEGTYLSASTPEALAANLTSDLFALTHDKHLAVTVVPESAGGSAPTVAADESREESGRRSNYGIQRAEILSGNVGYLNLTAFFRPNEARDALSAAMRVVTHADALILDLRDNGGGSPDMVALAASYLFDTPGLPLFEIIPRHGNEHGRYATGTILLPERDGRRPLYVLTSARTWSGGEGLAFILQERHRAEVVGETTVGAANPGRSYPLNPRFNAIVPNGKLQSAVSGRNWEGVGVVPDVAVPASEALRVAQARALRQLLNMAPRGSWHDTLERELRHLEAQPYSP